MNRRFICLSVMSVLLLSGCNHPTDTSTTTTMAEVTTTMAEVTTTTAITTTSTVVTTTVCTAPYIPNATWESVFGCYEGSDGYYYRISDKAMNSFLEKKNRNTGDIEDYSYVNGITCNTATNGVVTFAMDLYNLMSCQEYNTAIVVNPDGTYCFEDITLKPITEGIYDMATANYPNNLFSGEESTLSVWYVEAFNSLQVMADLQSINNLFAVGRFDEAEAAIQEKIYDNLDKKVDEFISKRQYWHAENYATMYERFLDVNAGLHGANYPFVEDYFDERYKSYKSGDNSYGLSSGITAIVQPYIKKIHAAAANDTDVLTKEEALYLLNNHLIGLNMEPATWLEQRNDSLGYHYGVYDYNANGDDLFYIVCPYTKEVYPELPDHQFFTEGIVLW